MLQRFPPNGTPHRRGSFAKFPADPFRNRYQLIVEYTEVSIPLSVYIAGVCWALAYFCMLFVSLCHTMPRPGNHFLSQATRIFIQCVTASGQETLLRSYAMHNYLLYLMSYIRHPADLDLVCRNSYKFVLTQIDPGSRGLYTSSWHPSSGYMLCRIDCF